MAIKFQKEPMNAHSSIKHVIGVVSGKGGVGKSFVTASMAAAMRKKGYEVGIMDADITGPSIPKMYGIHGKAVGDGKEILPAVAEDGTRIMSVKLIGRYRRNTGCMAWTCRCRRGKAVLE